MNELKLLYTLALGLLAGLFVSRLVKPLKLPAVTGYLIAGLLIGPYCLGRLGITGFFSTGAELASVASVISDVALGFIAFAIGTEFKLSALKQTGKQAVIIGIVQALAAMLLVDGALIGLHYILGPEKLPLSVAVTLGAVATATAPAATLMVVKQYKAKGPLTSILLPVVALDDAVGLVCFAASIGVAQALEGSKISVVSVLVNPLLEVVLSLALGAAMGFLFTAVENMFKSNSKRLCLSITFVLFTIALSQLKFDLPGGLKIGFSSLLVCMMLGTIFCNICRSADELMYKTDRWTMPLNILFFVVSGAALELNVFGSLAVVIVGICYIIFRSAGKYIGAFLSAKATKCSPAITKYLGITLLPQAGVSIGMSLTAAALLKNGGTVRNIVLFAVLIYELVGPLLTKIALTKAGDIIPKTEPKHHLTPAQVFADEEDEEDIK